MYDNNEKPYKVLLKIFIGKQTTISKPANFVSKFAMVDFHKVQEKTVHKIVVVSSTGIFAIIYVSYFLIEPYNKKQS